MKTCLRCKKTKTAGEFSRNFSNTDGLQSQCKSCQGEVQRARRQMLKARNQERYEAERTSATPPPRISPVEEFEIDWEEPSPTPPPAPAVTSATPPPAPAEVRSALESAYEFHRVAKEKRDLKKEHGSLIEENQRLRDEIREILSSMRAPSVHVYRQPSWERSDAVACAVASDWHVEEPVEKTSVHGLNEFNLDIARSRSEHFFKNFLRLADIMAAETRVNTLYLAALGDFFSGWIHEELLANSLLAPGDAALFCKGLFFSGIDFLLRESSYVLEGDFIPGNHGRMTKTMHFGNPTGTSLETVMFHSIADRYHDNPRVRFNVSSQSMVYRRMYETFNMRLIHGYETKYLGGIGGLTIPLRKALAQWNNPIRADLTVLGHYHQFFDGGDFLVNGSLIGYNLYAQQIKASYEEPRQAFFLVHARKGGQKSITAPIWLDDAHHDKTAVAP